MTMLINNPEFEQSLIQERQALGIDQRDEVWEGVYVMPPLANNDHQRIATRLSAILEITVGLTGLGEVFAGVNLSASAIDWKYDYRVPDVVVFMAGSKAENHDAFWTGPADFVAEVTSPQERVEKKLPFYSRIGIRELLILDRQKGILELFRRRGNELVSVGKSSSNGEVLNSDVVPLNFRCIVRKDSVEFEVVHQHSAQKWRF